MLATKLNVGFYGHVRQYHNIKAEIDAKIHEVLESGQYVLGPMLKKFEGELAEFHGTKHAIGVGNGTDALWLTFLALGIGPGDECITTTNTFFATAEAIWIAGGTAVFVDSDPRTNCIDPARIEAAITPRTKAIVPVHLYGQCADMKAIRKIADKHHLLVIEDNAQAIGATYKGKRTGSFGDVACISFYPTKNLGAAGDAGMIVTDSAEIDARLRNLRNHGQSSRYNSTEPGWNSRLDEIQAAVLRVKLRYLPKWQKARQSHAEEYSRRLANVPGITTPRVPKDCEHVFHQYTIRSDNRDALQQHLAAEKIGNAVYYPVPLHLQPIYSGLGYKAGHFPSTERAAREVLSLPMFPELTTEQISRVTRSIADFPRL